MPRFVRFVLDHAALVVAGWVLLALAGAVTAGTTTSRLTRSFDFPGQDGYRANQAIAARYHTGAATPPTVALLDLPPGHTMDEPDQRAAADRAFRAAARSGPVRVADLATTGDRHFVLAGGHATFALVYGAADPTLPPAGPRVLAAVRAAAPAGARVRVTGFGELEAAGNDSGGVGVLAETVIGSIGALAVLAVLFASFLALLPLLLAIVSVLTTFLLVLALTAVTDISFVAQFLVSLIGLGVAIDYSLLLVTRWREERAAGVEPRQAVETAVATAGRAVLFSGCAVAVGLASLALVPVPFLRSLGYSGILIPLVSVAVSLTLLPIVLYRVGDRLDRPHRRARGTASPAWTAWTRLVVRRRWTAAAVGAGILAVLAVPFAGMHLGEASTGALAGSGPYRAARDALVRGGAPTGVLTPVEVLVRDGAADAERDRLARLPGVETAFAPAGAAFRTGGTAVVDVLPRAETGQPAGADTLARVVDTARGDRDVLGVGGHGMLDRDFAGEVYGNLPLILGALSLVTFVLLVVMFRSVLLPLKAVVFNLASLAAAYGILTLVWQDGHGSGPLWGVPATGAVTVWVPIIVFAFLFGLSMDYEVFLLSRIREEHQRIGDTDAAIVEGVGRTGRLVTGAALILFLAFLSLSTAPATEVKMLGTALGAGILLDATVVRALLVPAVVSLLGRAAWWLPGRRPSTEPPTRPTHVESVAVHGGRREEGVHP